MPQSERQIYEISIVSVIKILLLLLGVWLLYLVRDILLIILISAIIVVALEPFVERLAKQGIPRVLSVIVMYIALLVFLGFFIYFIIRPVAGQIKELPLNFPYYTSKLSEINLGDLPSSLGNVFDGFASKISATAGGLLNAIVSIFGGVVSTVTVFALTFYFLVEEEGIRKSIVSIIPIAHKERFYSIVKKLGAKLGDWMRGQFLLMLIVGTVDGIALWILGIEFALTLGVLSGLLEVIPMIGPILAAVAAVFVAFVSGVAPWKILIIVVIYILVQQLENQVLIPKIMQKAIGLSPVVVIIAILIGAKLLGLGGAVLAVPVAAAIQVLLSEYTQFSKS